MSASALLVIRVLMDEFVLDRFGILALSALWRQLPAHDRPSADQKGDTDNRRRAKRGEILQHEVTSTHVVSRGSPLTARA
jgi:hypothetical protein